MAMGCSDTLYSSSNGYNNSVNDSVGVYMFLYITIIIICQAPF